MELTDALAIARKVLADEIAYQAGRRTLFNIKPVELKEAYDVLAKYHATIPI